MRKIINNIFFRNIMLLSGGTVLAQALILLSTPALTRIYSPTDFGMLAIYAGILKIITSISSLRYETAIPLSKNNKDAVNVFFLCVLILAITSILLGGGIYFFSTYINQWIKYQGIIDYWWLIPIGSFFAGLYKVTSFWAIRAKSFAVLAKTKVIQALVMLSVQFAGFTFGAPALIIGQILGQSGGVGNLGYIAVYNNWKIIKKVTFQSLFREAKRHYRYPLYSVPSSFLSSAATQVPVFIFAFYYSPAIAGVFFLANRIMTVPMSLIGQAVAQAFLSEARDAHRNNDLHVLAVKVTKRLALITILPALFIFLYGETVLNFVLGEDWEQVGLIAKILLPAVIAQFSVAPISKILDVKNKQHLAMFINIAFFTLRAVPLFISAALYNDLTISVLVYSLSTTVGYIILLFVALRN